MDPKLEGKLVVAISSRALFNLDDAHAVYKDDGVDKYRSYQIEREDELPPPGTGLPLVQGLFAINRQAGKDLIEVVLVSRNDADTGLRVMNSLERLELPISRAVFTDGRPPYAYLTPLECQLFLSANSDDVSAAICAGFAAGLVYQPPYPIADDFSEVRIAFDGDAVLFSPEAEETFREKGLEEFHRQERDAAEIPLSPGPFKPFLEQIHRIQKLFPAENSPIRTALVTARSAPAHKRAVKTLRTWNVHVNESFFLGGLKKDGFLSVFRPHIFFDDQPIHCIPAATQAPTAQVLTQPLAQTTEVDVLPLSAAQRTSKRSANRSSRRSPHHSRNRR
jgi:5'-nucleotidase